MPTFQLDPTGVSPANLILGEGQAFVASNGNKLPVIVPTNGPFFSKGFVARVRLTAAGNSGIALNTDFTLRRWTDYIPILPYTDAISATGQSIYGGIMLLDPAMAGSIQLTYQTLGSTTLPSIDAITAFLSDYDKNVWQLEYAESFDITTDLSAVQPVFNKLTKSTISNLISAVSGIETRLLQLNPLPSDVDYTSHIADTNNPHGLMAMQLDLEKVPNWPTASTADAIAGTSRAMFVTPAAAAAAVGSRTSVPIASDTTPGTVTLNQGSVSADALDNVKVLTSAGLLSLMAMSQPNQIKTLFDNGKQQVFFSPLPLTYPCTCMGQACGNFQDLVSAVSAYTGILNISGSAKLGCIWLPHDVSTAALNMNTR